MFHSSITNMGTIDSRINGIRLHYELLNTAAAFLFSPVVKFKTSGTEKIPQNRLSLFLTLVIQICLLNLTQYIAWKYMWTGRWTNKQSITFLNFCSRFIEFYWTNFQNRILIPEKFIEYVCFGFSRALVSVTKLYKIRTFLTCNEERIVNVNLVGYRNQAWVQYFIEPRASHVSSVGKAR